MHLIQSFVVLILSALVIGQNMESTIFKNATIKFNLHTISSQEMSNISPNEIKSLLTKFSCKNQHVKLSETGEGSLEVIIDYACDNGLSSSGILTRISLICVVTLACIFLFFFVQRARKAFRVEGEISWRLWRVPQLRFMNANRTNAESQSDMEESKDTLYTTATISSKLEQTMFILPPRYNNKV